jgi:hypothetical protein
MSEIAYFWLFDIRSSFCVPKHKDEAMFLQILTHLLNKYINFFYLKAFAPKICKEFTKYFVREKIHYLI